MDVHNRIQENLEGYVLGILDAEEMIEVSQHLVECSECRARVYAYEEVCASLATSAPKVSPPPTIRTKLMQQCTASHHNNPTTLETTHRGRLERLGSFLNQRPRLNLAGATLGIVLIIVLGINQVQMAGTVNNMHDEVNGMTQEVEQYRNAVHFIMSRPIEVAAVHDARTYKDLGKCILEKSGDEYGRSLLLVLHDVPDPQPGYRFVLWLIDRQEQLVYLGEIEVSEEGYVMVLVDAPRTLDEFQAIIASEEPAEIAPREPSEDWILHIELETS